MVNFTKVEMKNFMAIKEATLELDNRGLILIEGENKTNESFQSNGSSKSSLVSSITYSLYGKTEKGLKADDVVNNKIGKNTYVKLYFDIGEDHYRIERYRKDKENKNKVKLFLNDKDITGSTNDVTDKQIQELFGIDFNTYLNSIIYGQGDIPMFSQATDKGKKEILESITKTDIYKEAQEVAKEKYKEVEEKQNNLEQEIEKVGYKKELTEQQFQKDLIQYQEVKKKQEEEEKYIEEQTNIITQERQRYSEAIEKVKEQIPKVHTEEYIFTDQYNLCSEGINKLNKALKETLEPEQDDLIEQQKAIHFNTVMTKDNLEKLDTSDTCPVCGSPIDNSHKIKEQEKMNETISNQEKQEEELQKQINQYAEKIITVKDKIDELRQIQIQEEQQKEQLEKENREKLQNQQQYYDKISQLEREMNQLQVPQANDYSYIKEPNQEEHQKEIKELEKTIDNYKDDIVQLESKKQRYNQAVNAFSNKGIRSVVLDFITPFLNEKANEYLQTLSGSGIEIEFQTQVENAKGELKDKFDVIVNNSKGGSSYKSNSAGEQKRIDIAISFAIQDLIMSKEEISTNIALYDEVFDGLDAIGCENVIKLLKDRLNIVSTIFVITHNENLKSLFDNTIKVIKEDGISRMED